MRESSRKILVGLGLALLIAVSAIHPAEARDFSSLYSSINPLYNPLAMPAYAWGVAIDQDVDMPPLSGPFQVGRTSYQLTNPAIDDLYRTGMKREFIIQIHYPADVSASSGPASYVEGNRRLAVGLLYAEGDPLGLDMVHSHAHTGVPISQAEASYPVAIFSHGRNQHPVFHTATLEDLASHGFIVISIEHPYDAMASVLDDGSVLMPPVAPKNERIQELEAAFTAAGLNPIDTENDLTLAAADYDQDAIATLSQTEIEGRIGDITTTVSALEELNLSHPVLAGRIDVSNVGVFGHSLGAFTATMASQEDSRITASVIMDAGQPLDLESEDTPPLSQPSFYMKRDVVGDQRSYDNVAYLMQSIEQDIPFSFLELYTATHMAFVSDFVLMQPYLLGIERYDGKLTDLDKEQAVVLLDSYINAFFTQYLKGQPQTLLAHSVDNYPYERYEAPPILINPLETSVPVDPTPVPTTGPSVVPEPGTFILVGLGLIGGVLALRRKKRS